MATEPSAEIHDTQRVTIRSVKDLSAALTVSFERGGLLLSEQDLCPAFFDLRSGLAGEVFQKFVNYRSPLAIVLPDSDAYGERFSELVYEHRQHATLRFFPDECTARQWLDSKMLERQK